MNDPMVKKYLRGVRRRLDLPGDLRDRVISDLETGIAARIETGEDVNAILRDMGSPKVTAEELNRQMDEFCYRKSPWRFLCLAVSAGAVIWVVITLLTMVAFVQATTGNASMGIIGGADGPTAVFVTGQTGAWIPVIFGAVIAAAGLLGYFKLRKLKK